MLAKITSKNQITLPKAVINAFPDVQYFDVCIKDNKIFLIPVKISPIGSDIESIRDKMRKLGITEKDVGEAIRWARRKSK
jgi:bifunctional DNA-binding transcriptional regulator/antitoxin component of YhaV-PrlF toxin-antitoxin module